TQLKEINRTQNKCLRKIYGAHPSSETKVMRHLARLPSMQRRTSILQAKFLYRAQYLPDDALLTHLRPYLLRPSTTHRNKLCLTPVWQNILPTREDVTYKELQRAIRQYLNAVYTTTITATTGVETLGVRKLQLRGERMTSRLEVGRWRDTS
ncbi:hypothetical protein BDB00DRAFT_772278, partial [Zychaea mexicana]|uniref:uncharacterized protein n=1 Tax=Zychaea mexicana TaxID=64656 RepID=UPI0022FEA6A9